MSDTLDKYNSLKVDLVKFNLSTIIPHTAIQTHRFFIHFSVAHKLISYTISYTSWIPKLDKKLQKYLFLSLHLFCQCFAAYRRADRL